MQTIVVASRKGGAGKTTISCHLAVEAERCGASVALIDTDPMQGLTAWYAARQAPTPLLFRTEGDLPAALRNMRESAVDLVFIDTPPAINADLDVTLRHADLVLIPVQPSPDDLRAVGSTVEMVNRAGRPHLFIVNRVKPRTRLSGETAIELSQHGPVCTTLVMDRIAYAVAKADGRTAPELDQESPAADEVASMWKYVEGRIGKGRAAA